MLDRTLTTCSPEQKSPTSWTVSHNLVEAFVLEEVKQQFLKLPNKTKSFVSQSDVIAYALNRLPAVYATTKDGLQRQISYIETSLKADISTTVMQGFAAVKVDPFRFSEPLYSRDNTGAETALDDLRRILGVDSLSWQNVADVVNAKLAEAPQPTPIPHQQHFDWTPIAERDYNSIG